VSDEYAPLADGWRLQRDFAVRSAGFPVSGLEVFGPGDETERLRSVARQARFREAVTWQNPAALVNAVVNVAENAPTKPSRARGREEIVAGHWQRYCAKNDTIGSFGPLAWGRIADDGPALGSRSGSLVRERVVHLEAWPVQELAAALDPQLRSPPARPPRTSCEPPSSSIVTAGSGSVDWWRSTGSRLHATPSRRRGLSVSWRNLRPLMRIRFTEMLPTPDEAWLSDADGNRFVSELRLVALDDRS
jgi:hypothetical protein